MESEDSDNVNKEDLGSHLRTLARNRSSELSKFVMALTKSQIKVLIDKDVLSPKGTESLEALLFGTSECQEGKDRRFLVIHSVLNKLRCSDVPSSLILKLLTVIRLEMPALPTERLKTILEDCIESIRSDNDVHTCWKDVIPECFRLMSARNEILDHCDLEITTDQFLKTSLQTLIQLKWRHSHLIPLSIMFLEIPLSKEILYNVINKLCCEFENLPPDTLPPLICHLLKLCKTYHTPLVYFRLSDYFNSKLYSAFRMKDSILQESESPNTNLDSIDECADENVQNIESTCLYYTCKDGGALKKFLAVLKNVAHRPSALLMSPFLVEVLLASEFHKETCSQALRVAIYSNFYEEQRRSEFIWCKDALPSVVDLKALVNILIENSTNYCHTITQGLLDTSISLICFGGLMSITNKLQEFGIVLLVKLIKKHPEVAEETLKRLRDKFNSETSNIKCIADSLKALFTHMPHKMMEYSVILQGLLEDCFILPEGRDWSDHRQIIDSLSCIVRLDSRLRDSLVMISRKGLFSSNPKIGCLAVCSFLSLVKALKGRNGNKSNLSQENSWSVLSQISTNALTMGTATSSRINNATVCMEIISLLKRCFSQNVEVRDQLYIELPNALHGRTELLESIFNIMHDHLTFRYYVSDTDTLPPLLLDKCVATKDGVVILQEPIGRFLFTIQTLLLCEQPAPGTNTAGGWSLSGDPEQFHGVAGKLYVIMLSLANRMGKCSPIDFIKDDGIGLGELRMESSEKCLILQQATLCCEALMAFRINEWTPTKTDQPQKLLNLLKLHSQILDFVKSNSNKPKKLGDKKKGEKSPEVDENDQNTANGEKAKKSKRGRKPVLKFSDMSKNKGSGFKMPTSIWNLYTICRSIELLYGTEVKWATSDQLNSIRNKKELHMTILKFALSVCSNIKSKKVSQQELTYIFSCAEVLYSNCICRLEDFCDFSIDVALLVLEFFNCIMQVVINNHNTKFEEFLKTLTKTTSYEDVGDLISVIAEKLGVQLESSIVNVPLTEDPSARKIPGSLFEIIANLLQNLPSRIGLCEKWTDWVKKLTCNDADECKHLGSPFISCLINLVARSSEPWNICDDLAKKLSHVIGVNSEIETDSIDEGTMTDFSIINTSNAQGIFLILCSHINIRIMAVDTVIGRIKADQAFIPYRKVATLQTARASLKNRERAVCSELNRAANVIRLMSSILCPHGPCCDAIIKLVSKLHSTLAVLTSHFMLREPHVITSVRFDKLVKVCGRGMSKVMDGLISHVESASESGTSGAKAQARMIKDTKLIPKLVYSCELFYKRLHQLSSKTKVDLVCHLSKGSARDFRIKASDVKEALRNNNMECDEIEDADETSMEVDNEAVVDSEDVVMQETEEASADEEESE